MCELFRVKYRDLASAMDFDCTNNIRLVGKIGLSRGREFRSLFPVFAEINVEN